MTSNGRGDRNETRLKTELQASHDAARRGRRIECRARNRELSSNRRQWTCDVVAGRSEARLCDERTRVVPVIEQIRHFHEELQLTEKRIAGTEIGDSVTRRSSRTEIVDPIRLAEVVLIATRERCRGRAEIDVDRKPG